MNIFRKVTGVLDLMEFGRDIDPEAEDFPLEPCGGIIEEHKVGYTHGGSSVLSIIYSRSLAAYFRGRSIHGDDWGKWECRWQSKLWTER